MAMSHLLLTLGWVAYGLIHSLLASVRVKEKFRGLLGSWFRYYRLAYSLIALGLLALLIFWQLRIPSLQLWKPNLYTRIPASILIISGLAGIVICLKKYLVSPEGFSDLFVEGKKPVLQIKGFHRYVRHPLYLSTFLFLTGLLIAFPSLSFALSTTVIIGYTVFAIPLEEQKLLNLYGEEYGRYQKEVPALIPNQLTNWLIR
jgi:protein-S-isoprenylcysteine O-methyltransferase Ste14